MVQYHAKYSITKFSRLQVFFLFNVSEVALHCKLALRAGQIVMSAK
jgi:hypothetical protein